jgi:hypothetical protein
VSDVYLRAKAEEISRELSRLRRRINADAGDSPIEPEEKEVLDICRRIDSKLEYELIAREFFPGLIVKVVDPKTKRFCLIPPDDEPTKVEAPGRKKYLFNVEMSLNQTVEVEADDLLEAHDMAFSEMEEMPIGECDEVSATFHSLTDEFGPGFSLN